MTIPAPTHTRTPTSVTLTAAAPTATVTLDDTGSYSPAATARQWKADTVAITGATSDPQTVTVIGKGDGTIGITITVTNGDGNGTSASSDITVTDSVDADATTALGSASYINRMSSALPAEWSDPTIATPGLPTAKKVYQARTYGSVLPADLTANVIV